jgi:tetratricopeptide (TPR) repeat protein
MRLKRLFATVTIGAVLVFSLPALVANAWGPRATRAIARTGIHVVPPDVGAALRQYEEEVFDGAGISDEELLSRFPQYSFGDPILTVISEIELLRAAKARGASPYLAYRVGVLGQLVADMNQPFFTAPGSEEKKRLRDRYEADAEDVPASGIAYEAAKRQYLIDVRSYFEERRNYLADAEALIASDYDTGAGFGAYGKRSLSVHFTNAVNAVADIWFTLIGEPPVPTGPPARPVSLRDYYVDAIGFYLGRDQDEAASAGYAFLESGGLLEQDTLKRVGDQYYDNARYERAIALYRTVLQKEPRRADVRMRISDYYFTTGLALLAERRYGEAEKAFDEVLENDVSRADARQKKLEVARLIEERKQRLELARMSVSEARKAIAAAARAEAQHKFADAVRLYRQAEAAYAKVDEEFDDEHLEASQAAARIEAQVARLIAELVNEVRALQTIAVREQTRELIRGSSERELRGVAAQLVRSEHDAQAEVLRTLIISQEREALQR